jgi:hypothetical protein
LEGEIGYMIHLLKVAFRNFLKEKFYTLLHIGGLAVGIAVSLLIPRYIYSEFSYDRFHSESGRIQRLVSHLEIEFNQLDGISATLVNPVESLKNE